MAKSSLKNLQPIAGKHAIQEVVFTLHLDKGTPLEKSDVFKSIHKGKFKKDFPKFAMLFQKSFHFKDDMPQVSNTVEGGFSFEQYFQDGRLRYRVRAQKSGNEDGENSWIAVNILDYDRWKPASGMAYDWLRKVAVKQKGLNAAAITLQYIDILNWNDDGMLPYDAIFNTGTIYLPPKFSGNAAKWHASFAYEEKRDNYNKTNKLSVTTVPNAKLGSRIVIDNPLTIVFEKPVNINKGLAARTGELVESFQGLHDQNKQILKDVLSKEVCSIIGLK